MATAQQVAKVTPSGIGYLEYLPGGYHSNSNDYPVVISLHGIKEKGTSSTDEHKVLKDLPRVANVGLPKYVKTGKKYRFILISPQLKSQYGSWPASFVMEVVNHVKRTLRIDEKRIYLTGLSLGGFGVWKTAGEYPEVFAAIAPICAGGNSLSKASAIAKEDVAAWGFHGGNDRIVSYTVTTNMVNAINSAKPNPLAKVTIFPGMGHIIWDKAYNDTNLLDWMLSYRNGSERTSGSEDSNSPPVADAGPDKTLTAPASSVTLDGKGSDTDGRVTGLEWTKVSGGHAKLGDASSEKLKVSDMSVGTYVFKLTVKDNDGASDFDEVTIVVKQNESQNTPPVVSAGADRSLTLPHNAVSLRGSASDQDGAILSYQWTQISGESARINGAASKAADVSGLKAGSYAFRLTVTDNDGASSHDDIRIKVTARASANGGSNKNSSTDDSDEILPQDYEGPDRNNGEGIDYIEVDDQPWLSGN